MTLTSAQGPFANRPAGLFTPPLAGPVVYIEPYRKRVQGISGGRIVVDSERAVLVHRTGRPPTYAFPFDDVTGVDGVHAKPTSEVAGYAEVAWSAMDAWREEGESLLGIRNPYHRVDFVRGGRRLCVEVHGLRIVDTTDTLTLYETSLDPKLYVDRSSVQGVELVASDTKTYCPYKGTASYWTAVVGDTRVDDIAWSYDDPLHESMAIACLLSFDPLRSTIETNLPPAAI